MQTPLLNPSLNLNSFIDKQALINAVNNLVAGSFTIVRLDNSVKEPDVHDGTIAYTDGVSWNPGSGQGFYGYYNSAWHLLG